MENLDKIKKFFSSPSLKAVYSWSKCVRSRIALICVIEAVVTILSLGSTLVTREFIDTAVAGQEARLWLWAGGLVLLTLSIRGLNAGLSVIYVKTSSRLQRFLQEMIVKEVMRRDYAGLKGFHSGELVNRFFSDAGKVKDGILYLVPGFFSTVIGFLGAAVILLSMDWRFLPLLIAGGFVSLGIVLIFRSPIKKRRKRMLEAEDSLHSTVQETMENIRLIKASVSENRFIQKVDARQGYLESEQVRQGKVSTLMHHGIGVVFDVSWLLCMIVGCVSISRGGLTYGALAALIQLIGRIEGPIANTVTLASEAYGMIVSAERLQELTSLPEEQKGEALKEFDEICLENVSFRYEDGTEDVLDGVSCAFKRGTISALIGESGKGKTSLFQLLLGIYRPTEGDVFFRSGTKHVPASRGTRELIAYVPQGNTLFSGTLRDNLTLFSEQIADEAIVSAMKTACIDDLAETIGLDVELGERGIGLSEGQAQRVAIARALLMKAPVLLLDESTSALDEETEARLLNNLSELQNKTCIIVTHRRAALRICQRVITITDGQLFENGSQTSITESRED